MTTSTPANPSTAAPPDPPVRTAAAAPVIPDLDARVDELLKELEASAAGTAASVASSPTADPSPAPAGTVPETSSAHGAVPVPAAPPAPASQAAAAVPHGASPDDTAAPAGSPEDTTAFGSIDDLLGSASAEIEAQAAKDVTIEQVPAPSAGPAASDSEAPPTPVRSKAEPSLVVPPPRSAEAIEAFDKALAERADHVVAAAPPEVVEPEPVEPVAVAAAPSPAPASAATTAPAPAKPASSPAPAPSTASAATVVAPAPAPARAPRTGPPMWKRTALAPLILLTTLGRRIPDGTRQTIGWIAIMTAFWASVAWGLAILRSPTPDSEQPSAHATPLLKPGDPEPAHPPDAHAADGTHGEHASGEHAEAGADSHAKADDHGKADDGHGGGSHGEKDGHAKPGPLKPTAKHLVPKPVDPKAKKAEKDAGGHGGGH